MINSLISKYENHIKVLNTQLAVCNKFQALAIRQQIIDAEMFIYYLKLIKEHDMINHYDYIKQQIARWSEYVELHTKIGKGKNLPPAWENRMNYLRTKVKKLEQELAHYETH